MVPMQHKPLCTRICLPPRNHPFSDISVPRQHTGGFLHTSFYLHHIRHDKRVSCAASEQAEAPSKPEQSQAAKLRELQAQLQAAVKEEDFSAAARLRDKILELERKDPVKALKAQLEQAIDEQDFKEAARCRDELKKLVPEPKPRTPLAPPPPTSSDVVTNGVRVEVKSAFLPHRSRPGSYIFSYRIRIRNESADQAVKLHSRHWIITDANMHQDIIRGLGVIGEQPELGPGEEHVYGSYAPLRTPAGKMKGSFHMQVKGDNGEWQSGFDAEVGVFGLDMSDATPAKW